MFRRRSVRLPQGDVVVTYVHTVDRKINQLETITDDVTETAASILVIDNSRHRSITETAI